MNPLVAAGGIAALILGVLLVLYNRLVRIGNHCDEAWADIETELQRRYDLIPNLVQTVKGYAQHERALLEEVTRLRELCAANHGTPHEQAASENQLVHGLRQLLARVENYPQLKADRNFLELQKELANTENRIQAARRFYNGNVRENNNLIEMVPTNLIATLFGFQARQFFELQDRDARDVPAIEAIPKS